MVLRYTPLKGCNTPGITRRLIRETLAWQPDIVHCFKPKAYSGLAGWWLWQFYRNRIRLVMDTDDWEGWGGWNELAPYSPLQKHFFAWQERWGMQHNHALTVASRALETIVLSMGVPAVAGGVCADGVGIGEWKTKNKKQKTEKPTLLLYSRLFEFDVVRLVRVLVGVKNGRSRFQPFSAWAQDCTPRTRRSYRGSLPPPGCWKR